MRTLRFAFAQLYSDLLRTFAMKIHFAAYSRLIIVNANG